MKGRRQPWRHVGTGAATDRRRRRPLARPRRRVDTPSERVPGSERRLGRLHVDGGRRGKHSVGGPEPPRPRRRCRGDAISKDRTEVEGSVTGPRSWPPTGRLMFERKRFGPLPHSAVERRRGARASVEFLGIGRRRRAPVHQPAASSGGPTAKLRTVALQRTQCRPCLRSARCATAGPMSTPPRSNRTRSIGRRQATCEAPASQTRGPRTGGRDEAVHDAGVRRRLRGVSPAGGGAREGRARRRLGGRGLQLRRPELHGVPGRQDGAGGDRLGHPAHLQPDAHADRHDGRRHRRDLRWPLQSRARRLGSPGDRGLPRRPL